MNVSAQKALLDALTQHQAYLYRTSSQSVNELTKQFNNISNVKISRLNELLGELTNSELNALKSLNFSSKSKSSKHIEEIKALLNDWFSSVDVDLSEQFNKSALDLAIYEANYTVALMGEKLKTDGEKLYQKAKKVPFSGGQLVDSLFSELSESLRKKVEYIIRDGISQGLTNQQIIQKIKGRKSLDYKDGILKSSRESIERQVRTARSHVANVTYEDTYRALGVKELTACATLDGRTCIRCASLDGQNFTISDPKKPKFPEHPHSRTVYMPKVDNISGVRSFVADERKVKDIPKGQRDGKIGQVDANTSFKDWFAKQDESFQEEWLGPSRFQLYKNGQYSIDKFIDPQGRKYTLDELKKLDEQSFNTVFKATQSGKQFKQPFNEPSVYDLPKHVHKPDISTPTKKIAVKYEDEFRDAKKEYGVFIDGDGKTILTLSGDVNSKFGGFSQKITGGLSGISGGAVLAGAALGGAVVAGVGLAVASLSTMAIEVARNNVELAQFSSIANTTIEKFQGLSGAALTFGITPSSDDASIVKNGYVFDLEYYLSRFSYQTPDVVVIALGVNDLLSNNLTETYNNYVLMINQCLKVANTKIVVTVPSVSFLRTEWAERSETLIREIQRAINTVNSSRVMLAPAWTFAPHDVGFSLASTRVTDTISGAITASYEDPTHPINANAYSIWEGISAYIAASAI